MPSRCQHGLPLPATRGDFAVRPHSPTRPLAHRHPTVALPPHPRGPAQRGPPGATLVYRDARLRVWATRALNAHTHAHAHIYTHTLSHTRTHTLTHTRYTLCAHWLGADIQLRDEIGRTALIYAALNGHTAAVRELADRRADLNVRAFAFACSALAPHSLRTRDALATRSQRARDASHRE